MDVNKIRNNKKNQTKLKSIFKLINSNYKNEWLLKYEILELAHHKINEPWVKLLYNDLEKISSLNNDFSQALKRGLILLQK